MADSLRDQLLKSGLVQKLKSQAGDARAVEPRRLPAKTKTKAKARDSGARRADAAKSGTPRSQEDIDLARAYGLRERAERQQREQEKKAAEARAREKAERKQKLASLLDGKALNKADAELPRHFPHGDKIRRVYCTPEQLTEVNAGQLAVVQYRGRYLLVTREIAEQARTISPDALALLCDPNAPADDDIPADLIW
jgi:uncharacterized protein YaiL (DUF2058 family)